MWWKFFYIFCFDIIPLLLGQCHEIFDFCFIHESVSPKNIGVIDTGGKFAAGVVDTQGGY